MQKGRLESTSPGALISNVHRHPTCIFVCLRSARSSISPFSGSARTFPAPATATATAAASHLGCALNSPTQKGPHGAPPLPFSASSAADGAGFRRATAAAGLSPGAVGSLGGGGSAGGLRDSCQAADPGQGPDCGLNELMLGDMELEDEAEAGNQAAGMPSTTVPQRQPGLCSDQERGPAHDWVRLTLHASTPS